MIHELQGIERRYLETGKQIYGIFIDASRRHWILNVTDEIDINFDIDNDGSVIFLDAWEIGAGGDWVYSKDERDIFEADHPGLIAKIEEKAKEIGLVKEKPSNV